MKKKSPAQVILSFAPFLVLAGCHEPNSVPVASAPTSQPVAAESGRAQHTAQEAERPYSPADVQGRVGNAEYKTASLCNVESLDGRPFGGEAVQAANSIRIRGWLADEMGAVPTNALLVLEDGNKAVVREIPIQMQIKRPDVVNAFPGKTGLETSGFEIAFNTDGLQADTYHLYLTYATGDHHYACDNGRSIRVSR